MLARTRLTLAITAAVLVFAPGTALAAADLSAAVTSSAATVGVGGTVDVTFSLTNHGPDAAASPRLDGLWDVSRLSFVQVVGSSGVSDGGVFDTGSMWFTGSRAMAPGETDSVTLRMKGVAPGPAGAQAGVTSPDANPVNNAAQASVTLTGGGSPGGGGGGSGGGAGGGGVALGHLSLKASKRLHVRTGRRLRLAYRAGASGRIRLDVLKRGKRIGRVRGHARKGRNHIAWRARAHGHKLKRGRYAFRLTLHSGGRTAVVRGTIRVRR